MVADWGSVMIATIRFRLSRPVGAGYGLGGGASNGVIRLSHGSGEREGDRVLDRRFGRYVAVGFLSATIDLGLVALLLPIVPLAVFAITAGYIAGLTANYLLHARYTFSVASTSVSQALRFAIVAGFNYLLTLFIVWALHNGLGIEVVASKALSLPAIAVCGFLLSKYWVFRAESAAGSA